jgi:hypothetical protein
MIFDKDQKDDYINTLKNSFSERSALTIFLILSFPTFLINKILLRASYPFEIDIMIGVVIVGLVFDMVFLRNPEINHYVLILFLLAPSLIFLIKNLLLWDFLRRLKKDIDKQK